MTSIRVKVIANILNKTFMQNLARTASYASSVAAIKAWYEAMGLKAGPMLPPVQNISPQEKELIKEELQKWGVI